MNGYIIKVIKLDGRHKGDIYYMGKGGYIVNPEYVTDYCQYKTEAIAKRVCTRLFNNNELNARLERQRKGDNCDWYIYDHELFEPFKI